MNAVTFSLIMLTCIFPTDMVVEVLSPSTRKNDFTIKKDIYEKNGVKEYWIVDQRAKTVDVYILRDGKFNFDESYHKYDAD